MKDEYISTFYNVVKDTCDTEGYEIPVDVESYIVYLLADKVSQPNLLPEPNFAIAFLSLSINNPNEAKNLGDTCLFVSGVFPDYGSKKGLSARYYADIGKTSYTIAQHKLNENLFRNLSENFDFFRNFINITVNKAKIPGLFE